jgi:hypothetical protein
LKILVGGDSFADPNFKSLFVEGEERRPRPVWGDIVAKNLGSSIDYSAESGKSNEWIIHNCIRMIHKYKYSVVIVALTNWERCVDMWGHNINPRLLQLCKNSIYEWEAIAHPSGWKEPTMLYYNDFGRVSYNVVVNKNLTWILNLIMTCVYTNTKLAAFQMLEPMLTLNSDVKLLNLKKNALFDSKNIDLLVRIEELLIKYSDLLHLDEWPFVEMIGGMYAIETLGLNKSELDNTLIVGNGDSHPNKKGHEVIANYVLNEVLPKVYKK